jgi:hypothetical protein
VHVPVVDGVVLLGPTRRSADLACSRKAEDVQVRRSIVDGTGIEVVIGEGIRRIAGPGDVDDEGEREAEKWADVDFGTSHLVIPDRGYDRRLVQELRIDLEQGALPLCVGPFVVGVVAQQQEEVDGLPVGVVDLEPLLDLDGLSGVRQRGAVAKRGPEIRLRRAPRVTHQPDMGVAILWGFVLIGGSAEALLDARVCVGPRRAQRVVVGLVRSKVDEGGFLVIARRHRGRGALGPIGSQQVVDLLGPASLVGLAAPLDDGGVGSHLLQEEPLRRGRVGDQAAGSQQKNGTNQANCSQ